MLPHNATRVGMAKQYDAFLANAHSQLNRANREYFQRNHYAYPELQDNRRSCPVCFLRRSPSGSHRQEQPARSII